MKLFEFQQDKEVVIEQFVKLMRENHLQDFQIDTPPADFDQIYGDQIIKKQGADIYIKLHLVKKK